MFCLGRAGATPLAICTSFTAQPSLSGVREATCVVPFSGAGLAGEAVFAAGGSKAAMLSVAAGTGGAAEAGAAGRGAVLGPGVGVGAPGSWAKPMGLGGELGSAFGM